jgi:hypothetical protein
LKNQGLTFADRLETAAKAKQALLEKARQKDPSNDPEFAARQAARVEAARLREERETEKRNARLAEQAEREAEAARKAAEAQAEADRIRSGKRPVSKPALSESEQKALRDARYAARKARKK